MKEVDINGKFVIQTNRLLGTLQRDNNVFVIYETYNTTFIGSRLFKWIIQLYLWPIQNQ